MAANHYRDRKSAQAYGNFGEALGAWLLKIKGYRIIARQYRTHVGEIDLIARRGGVLAFIEVKARKSAEAAASAIGPRQQDRIVRAARAFLQERPDLSHLDVRFDALLVRPGPWFGNWPSHIVDAWRPDD